MKMLRAILLSACLLTGIGARAEQLTPQQKAQAQAQLAAAQKQALAIQAQLQQQQAQQKAQQQAQQLQAIQQQAAQLQAQANAQQKAQLQAIQQQAAHLAAQQRAQQQAQAAAQAQQALQAAQQRAQQQAQLAAQQKAQQAQSIAQQAQQLQATANAQQRAQLQAIQQQAAQLQAQQSAQAQAQQKAQQAAQSQARQTQQRSPQQTQAYTGSYKGVAIRAGSDADIQAQMRAIDASQTQAPQLQAQAAVQAQQKAQTRAQQQAQVKALQQQTQQSPGSYRGAAIRAGTTAEIQAQMKAIDASLASTPRVQPGPGASSLISASVNTPRAFGVANTTPSTATNLASVVGGKSSPGPGGKNPSKLSEAVATANKAAITVGNTAIAYGEGTRDGVVAGTYGVGRNIQNAETYVLDHPQQSVDAVAAAARNLSTHPVATVAATTQSVTTATKRTFGQTAHSVSQTLQSTDPTVIAHGLGSTVEAGAILDGAGKVAEGAAGAGRVGSLTVPEVSVRPTWQQSELDVEKGLGSTYRSQLSFKNGQMVPYGTQGSVRPDFANMSTKSLMEVKNYNIGTGSANLIRDAADQISKDAAQLSGWRIQLSIDIRGQILSSSEKDTIRTGIIVRSNGLISARDIIFLQ